MTNIIPYESIHAAAFRQLNMEWLNKYQLMETHDMMVLDDPNGTILDRGGCIFLAMDGEEVIGSAALMKGHNGIFELAKMAVLPAYQGRGISKLLINKCLETAEEMGLHKLILYSNSQLTTALKLYMSYGFYHVPVTDAPFLTADVKMELVF
jgi:GNAT superfamily N-acetyltransferase